MKMYAEKEETYSKSDLMWSHCCFTSVTHSPTVCVFGFRGVIRVDVNIQDIDLDQCATGEGWFADTHQCNRTTMEVNTV